jgi:hypothetical protein
MVEEHRLILRGKQCAADLSAALIKAFFRDLTATLGMTLWKGQW